MAVSYKRIPTIANAVDFAEVTTDKRDGERAIYSDTTDPTLAEINKKLLRSEEAVTRMMQTSFKALKRANETSWFQYVQTNSNYYYRSGVSRWMKASTPKSVNLQYHPVISVTSITLIINDAEVDIVDSSDYSEGWADEYWIDYENGILYFKNLTPTYNTPVKTDYIYGNVETSEGVVLQDSTVASNATETTLTIAATTVNGELNGKLIEFKSGLAVDNTYRVLSSTHDTGTTTITVLSGYTMTTDGVLTGDTFLVYGVPPDIVEIVCIHAFLGIIGVDPTYLFTLTNPPEDFAPQYPMVDHLVNRLMTLLSGRESNYTLLN